MQGDLHSLATQLSADHNGKPSTVIGGATKHDQLHGAHICLRCLAQCRL